MNIEEVEEPETMKIYRQNPLPSVADTRKLRKFTDETNMQARNHENSDEICAQPVRHLDLATPAFYHYRKNPKCYHTVWGKRQKAAQSVLYIKYYAVLQSASQCNKLPLHITKCDKVLLPSDSTKYQPVLQRTILLPRCPCHIPTFNSHRRITVATHETSSIHMHWTGQQRPPAITTK